MVEVVPLRRNTQFQMLWLGGAVAMLGRELIRLAMPLMVLAITGSPGLAGVVAGAGTAAYVLAQMPAGVLVDRWDRRRTLITGQAMQTVNSAGLAVLVLAGQVEAWHFIVFGVVNEVCAAFVGSARTTAIRGIVPSEQMHSAYAQEESRTHAAKLIGPPLGGLLYGLGRSIPFVVDAIAFFIATLFSVFAKVPRRPAGPPSTAKPSMRREAGEAFAWLWRQRGLRAICGAVMVLNLLGGAFTIPLIVLIGERGGDAFNTGTVIAGIGVGGLLGALISGRTGKLLPPGKLLVAVLAIFGACLAAIALPFGPWWPILPLILIMLSTPALNVVMGVVIARMVPESMLGRMDAVLTISGMGLAPLGPILGGTLAAALGGAESLIIIGTLLLLTAAAAMCSRDLRHFTGDDSADSVNIEPADADLADMPTAQNR